MTNDLDAYLNNRAEIAAKAIAGFGMGRSQSVAEAKCTIHTAMLDAVNEVVKDLAVAFELDFSIKDPDVLADAVLEKLTKAKHKEPDYSRTDLRIIADHIAVKIDGKLCEAIADLLTAEGERESLLTALKAVQDTAASALARHDMLVNVKEEKSAASIGATGPSRADRDEPIASVLSRFEDEKGVTAATETEAVLAEYETLLVKRLAAALHLGPEVDNATRLHDAVHAMQQTMIKIAEQMKDIAALSTPDRGAIVDAADRLLAASSVIKNTEDAT